MNKSSIIPVLFVGAAEAVALGYVQATGAIPVLPSLSLTAVAGTPLLLLFGSLFAFTMSIYYNAEPIPGVRPPLQPAQELQNGLLIAFVFNLVLLSPYVVSSNALVTTIRSIGSIAEAFAALDVDLKYVGVQIASSIASAIVVSIVAARRNQPRIR